MTLALGLGLCLPQVGHAATTAQPLGIPSATFDFEDGLQGWTVHPLPTTLEARTPSEGHGLHDTTWDRVRTGNSGSHGVALTSFGGAQEKYGDAAHVALVSPTFLGDGARLIVEAAVKWGLEGEDAVHLEWAPVGDSWRPIESFGGGEVDDPFAVTQMTADDFRPTGAFQIRFRLVSDAYGSGVTPSPNYDDTFRLDDVRVATDVRPLRRWSVGEIQGRPGRTMPTAVVALASGPAINPYHEEFRDPSSLARRHPSAWIEGYPSDAEALVLSLRAPSLQDAITADREVWANVRADQLYWIPGTKVVGIYGAQLMADELTGAPGQVQPCREDGGCDLRPGESVAATWAASRAVGWTAGACPDCRIAVFAGKGANSVDAVAANAVWVDMAGILVTTLPGTRPYGDFDGAAARVAERMFVTAPSRQADFDIGVEQAPLPSAASSPGYAQGVLLVGGHDNGHVHVGNEIPTHLVGEVCGSVVAHHDRMAGTAPIGLTPMVSQGEVLGHAGQLLLHARRALGQATFLPPADGPLADGELSQAELRRLVLATATARPDGHDSEGPRCAIEDGGVRELEGRFASAPVRWADVPDSAPGYVNLGYGATDRRARELAVAVLDGEAGLPERPSEDAWFAIDDAARAALPDVQAWWAGLAVP